MNVMPQIILGSLLLLGCSIIHITLLIWTVTKLRHFGPRLDVSKHRFKLGIITGFAFGTVVAAHTIQVWLWAAALALLGAFTEIADAIYFSLVTYTTLGYGDVVLDEGLRIFGAMASVTGLLNFGLSTAFLVSVFTHLLDREKY